MIYKLIKLLLKYVSTKEKLLLADILVDDVVRSEDYHINDVIAERIIVNVIKSTGNKVTSFIVKD